MIQMYLQHPFTCCDRGSLRHLTTHTHTHTHTQKVVWISVVEGKKNW